MKEKYIFPKAKESTFKACLYNHESKTCTSNICGLSLFQHRQFLCNQIFPFWPHAASVCREVDIGRQGMCWHCMSDFLSFAVCPPDVPKLVEVEVTLNKAGLALPAIFCVKQLG